MSGWKKRVRLKGLRVPRLLPHTNDGTLYVPETLDTQTAMLGLATLVSTAT